MFPASAAGSCLVQDRSRELIVWGSGSRFETREPHQMLPLCAVWADLRAVEFHCCNVCRPERLESLWHTPRTATF